MTSGFGEERALHAMCIDDAYCVERVLAHGAGGTTELVTIDSSGPYLRKRIPVSHVNRKAWAALAECSCPRLPHVVATYETPDEYVVVCSFVPGDTVAQVVATQGRLAADAAVRVVQEVCEAAGDLHAHGAVHCDISPENIVIAADGAHLVDLGIACMLGQSSENNAAPLGTWGFAAPEQFGFAQVDERTDVFALACLLGYLLTGLRPDDASHEVSLADEQRVSKSLYDVVKRGSAFEPSARYPTTAALGEAAAAAVDDMGVDSDIRVCEIDGEVKPRGRQRSRATEKKCRRPAVVVACIAGGLMGVICVAFGLFWYNASGMNMRLSEGYSVPQKESTNGGDTEVRADEDEDEDVVQSTLPESVGSVGTQGDFVAKEDIAAASKALSIVESNWYVEKSGYVSYVFGLRNDSADLTIATPAVQIVGRDERGLVVSSDEQYLCMIQPDQTIYFAGLVSNARSTYSVDFTVKEPRQGSVRQAKDGWAVFAR